MTSMDRRKKGSDRRNGASVWAALAASILLCAMTGCWESSGVGAGGGGDTDADGDADPETDSLEGWSCTDLSPCVYSNVTGYSCPGGASGVKCWNLASKCDALYLCANSSQACEIVCTATTCEESAAIPPHPVCY